MSEVAMDTGKVYLEGLYHKAGIALNGAVLDVRGNQFEVSRLIGEVLAVHDSQDALLWRTNLRKLGMDSVALDGLVSPAIDQLRIIRSHIVALGIDSNTQLQIELALGSVHSGADAQIKNLDLE